MLRRIFMAGFTDPVCTFPSRPAAFFDRDGVINIDHGYIDSVERFEMVERAGEALRLCREAGYLIFVVTNQSGVARGYFDERTLDKLHRHMRTVLAEDGATIDDIRYCPHHIDAVDDRFRQECSWRKPGPGMILDLVRQWQIDRSRSFLVGDKTSDLEAAATAGIGGHLFPGGNLADFVRPILTAAAIPRTVVES